MADSLFTHASKEPDRIAFRYLVSGDCDGAIQHTSYARLAVRVKAVAAQLQERKLAGSRAVLLYSSSLDFVAAFLGCLAAGVIAVPAVPPRGRAQNHRALIRLRHLIGDADARTVLGDRAAITALDETRAEVPGLGGIVAIATEDVPDDAADSWHPTYVAADDVAYLQYTSGSTSAPRGVMVTHANLADNERILTQRWGHDPDMLSAYAHELFVSWLPLYHDMGLVGPVLNTVYLGATATLLSPLHFLQRPDRWLTAIDRFRPHTSGSPNFAYELCLRHATEDLVDRLDLSSWRVAFNGAEPVRAATLRRFTETFEPAKLQAEAFFPCYGLAEATLMVTGGSTDERPILLPVDGDRHNAPDAAIVGCGRAGSGLKVVIVDPERNVGLSDGEAGEIWVRGASVAKGYWRNALATRRTFQATLAGHEGTFLRTGDLGFLRDGELFVTGRIKDLLIIDGRNYYPQDLELSTELAHPALRPGCTAAFSVDAGADGERPVVVAEVAPDSAGDRAKIVDLVRGAIGAEHGLPVHDVVLVRPGTIPKTSSGKIQRRATRERYLDGTLAVLDEPTDN